MRGIGYPHISKVKVTRCLRVVELVFEKRLEPFVIKLGGFPFTLRINPAFYGSQEFDLQKWSTVFVDEVKGKPCNFK